MNLRIRMIVSIVLVGLISLASASVYSCGGVGGRDESAGSPALLERTVVIGASASSGAGIPMTNLAQVIGEEVATPRGPIASYADSMMWVSPRKAANKMVAEALENKPTLVIASDFLFWYVYGNYKDDATRLLSLSEGLGMLEKFNCQVVVGTIPNMLAAAGGILPKAAVPSEVFLAHANEHIRKWAQEHRAIVVPLAEIVAAWHAGKPFRIGAAERDTAGLLQKDNLHPNEKGLRMLARLIIQTLIDSKKLPAACLR